MDTDYNAKIIKVLKKLLEPDFKVKNDVYLNSLLTHLTSNPGTCVVLNAIEAALLTSLFCRKWLQEELESRHKAVHNLLDNRSHFSMGEAGGVLGPGSRIVLIEFSQLHMQR